MQWIFRRRKLPTTTTLQCHVSFRREALAKMQNKNQTVNLNDLRNVAKNSARSNTFPALNTTSSDARVKNIRRIADFGFTKKNFTRAKKLSAFSSALSAEPTPG
jgi:hypothetical protein